MDDMKVDRRVKKTKAVLRQAFVRLMAQKKVSEITVKELCELADVNRGTFYLHYTDVYAFYDAFQDEICVDVMGEVFKGSRGEVGDPGVLFNLFYNLLCYIEENREVCSLILGPNWSEKFFDRILEEPRERCLVNWSAHYGVNDDKELETMYYYIVSGCLGLIKRWFEQGLNESPEHMASRMERYITKGMMALSVEN